MSSKVTDAVLKLVTPYAESLGIIIVDIEYLKKFNGMNLTIYIYKEEGVSIDLCEKFHKLINDPLDHLNPTEDKPYILNVSSPGLDRPLKTEADFNRNIGKELQIKFYSPFDGKKETEGVLEKFDNGIIYLKLNDGNTKEIKQDIAAKVVLKINF